MASVALPACGAGESVGPANAGTEATDHGGMAAGASDSAAAYPALSRELHLPELPGGQVVSTGRVSTSLRDGLVLDVTSELSVEDARQFYSVELGKLGWQVQPSRAMPGMPMAAVQASRDGVTYAATITNVPEGGCRVHIVVNE
ncbi:MAG: hypothetical protein AB7P67_04220 [Vicinamibacterales bacterium]